MAYTLLQARETQKNQPRIAAGSDHRFEVTLGKEAKSGIAVFVIVDGETISNAYGLRFGVRTRLKELEEELSLDG